MSNGDKPFLSAYRDGPKPVDTPEFWRQRIFEGLATGRMLHQVIYDEQWEVWDYTTFETAHILNRHVLPESTILDAGCGYGALIDSIRIAQNQIKMKRVFYKGVDISPDLIEIGRYRYPGWELYVGDLINLQWLLDKSVDWAVFRSVREMIQENEPGETDWQLIKEEISRVAKSLMIIEYPDRQYDPVRYWVDPLDGAEPTEYLSQRGKLIGENKDK